MVWLAPCKHITMVHLFTPWQEVAVHYLKWNDGCEEQIATDAYNKQVSEASNPKGISFKGRTSFQFQLGKEGTHTNGKKGLHFPSKVQKELSPYPTQRGPKPNQPLGHPLCWQGLRIPVLQKHWGNTKTSQTHAFRRWFGRSVSRDCKARHSSFKH